MVMIIKEKSHKKGSYYTNYGRHVPHLGPVRNFRTISFFKVKHATLPQKLDHSTWRN